MQAAELSKHASSRTMEACKQQNSVSMQATEPWKQQQNYGRWRVVRSAIRTAVSSAGCRTANDHVSWSARSGPHLSPYREKLVILCACGDEVVGGARHNAWASSDLGTGAVLLLVVVVLIIMMLLDGNQPSSPLHDEIVQAFHDTHS